MLLKSVKLILIVSFFIVVFSVIIPAKAFAATLSFDVYTGYNWYYGGPDTNPICHFEGFITTCNNTTLNRRHRHNAANCGVTGGKIAEGNAYLLACVRANCARAGSDNIDFSKVQPMGSCTGSCEAEIRDSYVLAHSDYDLGDPFGSNPGTGGRGTLSTTASSSLGFKIVMHQTAPLSADYRSCINASSNPTFGNASGTLATKNQIFDWDGSSDESHTVYFSWLSRAPWFTTYLGGALSGKTGGAGIVDTIAPDTSPSFLFKEVVVQGSTTNPPQARSEYGMLLTTENFSARGPSGATYDANASYIGGLNVTDSSVYIGSSDLSLYTQVDAADCPSGNFIKTNKLDPRVLFYKVGLTCAQNAFDGLSSSYNFRNLPGNPGGVVVLFVEASSTDTLTISNPVTSQSASERLILITPAKVVIGSSINTAVPYQPSATANIQMAIITASTFSVAGSSGALVVEGPIIAGGAVSLNRETSNPTYPGVLVSYNPKYLGLFRTTLDNYISSTSSGIPSLLVRKVRWVHE